jgi:DNA-binding transcriptional regulator YiaG
MTAKLLTLPPRATDSRPGWKREARLALREWRCAEEITQPQAARRLQCSADAVSCWERGVREVPGWVLVAIGAVQRVRKEAA